MVSSQDETGIFDELDIFDGIEVSEDEVVSKGETVVNEELADRLKSQGKSEVNRQFVKDKTYPYFEICLTAEAQIHEVTLNAIQGLLSASVAQPQTAEEVASSLDSDNATICVGVSTDESLTQVRQERVLGAVHFSKVRYLYSLVRNVHTRLHLNQNQIFEGSKLLALL